MKTFAFLLLILCIGFSIFHIMVAISVAHKKITRSTKKLPERGMSILIPCYNEGDIIETSLLGIANLNYRNYEVFYINDGSTDHTLKVLKELLVLEPIDCPRPMVLTYQPVRKIYTSVTYPHIFVIDKDNGGKADSLNTGITYAENEWIITLDADSLLQSDALEIINEAVSDENLIAAGGLVRILQDKHGRVNAGQRMKQLVAFQTLEYLKGFFILKASLAKMNALQVISGAFGIFRRQVLLEVDGYRRTIGEDIDITIKLQRYIAGHPDKHISFIPEAVCFTECPEKWGDLLRQRIRWQKAFVDCLITYRYWLVKELFHSAMGFFMIIDSFLVGTISTFFTIGSLVLMLVAPQQYDIPIILYLVVSTLVCLIYNLTALLIAEKYTDGDSLRDKWQLVPTIVLDILIWRLVNCLFIMAGTVLYLFNKHDWNKVERTGRVYEIIPTRNETT